ncbi:hypothetical protein LZ016_11350 [Sphingomonas sp. SM33]|uniref:Uncharacterized protein n=1 Tax=Sphingomonas telluris TaxID=2907998 RepID=A0ABS9VP05_9SPHN|nr:hypothetical protein [Sphingomonas telluris]MCH8616692.1 hypothetical protein [Sphingomonas telluris]
MAEGVWVLLGAALGTLGSLSTTWLSSHLSRQSKYPKFDRAVEELLKKMLADGPRWRKLETLASVTGLSEKHAKEYLIELGARGSETDGRLWGLISRNPLSEIGSTSSTDRGS